MSAASPGLWSRVGEELRSIVDRDPAARNRVEVALLYPGVHAVWSHRLSHALYRHRAYFLARLISQVTRWWTGIEIHPGATLGRRLFIDHGMGVVIGETAEVGDDVTIYHGVTLGGNSLEPGKRHPTVGDRVVIGAGAKVLGDLKVGSDSRIGANAVLVRTVREHSVVVGVPGQVIADTRGRVQPIGEDPTSPDPVGSTVKSLLARVQSLETAVMGQVAGSSTYTSADGIWRTEEDFSI